MCVGEGHIKSDSEERAIKNKKLLKKFRSKRESINQVIELAQQSILMNTTDCETIDNHENQPYISEQYDVADDNLDFQRTITPEMQSANGQLEDVNGPFN